ncbi:MAG: polysaccharide biosynthesis/export family protein [bacterium]
MTYFKSKSFTLILFLILLLSAGANLYAQNTKDRFEKKKKKDVRLPLRSSLDKDELKEEPSEDKALEFEMQALEASIDPNTYIVGPGDQFLINIWSTLESNIRTAVTPEGKLIIPTIGTMNVDGKTLLAVQQLVRKAGEKKYLQSKIDANLVRLRNFRVHVTGQVIKPGPYTALAVYRVSDILEQAGGLTTWGF